MSRVAGGLVACAGAEGGVAEVTIVAHSESNKPRIN
jgi:hypothetical protein